MGAPFHSDRTRYGIVRLNRAIGIVISKRQVVRLLNADTGPFVDKAQAVRDREMSLPNKSGRITIFR